MDLGPVFLALVPIPVVGLSPERLAEYSREVITTPSSLDIAKSATLRPIDEVAADLGIDGEHLEHYGKGVAKVDLAALGTAPTRAKPAKYVVVTAVTPTPLGEGKTTTSVGLVQGLTLEGVNAVVTLRQPSMGPTFGIKGGAAGGGYSQVVPMERINLHLTGDFHAVTAAHNLLAATVDNELHHGGATGLDPRNVMWRRVLDVNDRSLRNIVAGLGARIDGVPRQSGFDITASSEIMAILTLSTSLQDMRARLGRIVVGTTSTGQPVTAEDLKVAGAMAVILKDALKPNLLQTLESGPALVHCGPFGNIATGTSSVIGDRVALSRADVVVTEAGFGADMGAERFFDVKCRAEGLRPDAAVVVVTVRAMKAHSGRYDIRPGAPLPPSLLEENPDDVRAGLPNLQAHIGIVQRFGVTPVVAINAFADDHDSEHRVIRELCHRLGVACAVTRHVAEGGVGAKELVAVVREALEQPSDFRYLYDLSTPLVEKIEAIATQVYGAAGVDVAPTAGRALADFERLGFGELPVVIAKTHLSISSDPALRGAPTGWRMPVREVRLAAGAGYVYAICGDMRTMPGLPKHPNAEQVDLDADGEIVGLF
jgi:formate--tetrahydrofolate ligase